MMRLNGSLPLAFGGLAAMAAALGIGRFVYTPILPVMLDVLGWSKAEAGLVASANFLGYFVGALAAGRPFVSAQRRHWLLTALVISAVTTAGMALPSEIALFIGLRFVGGVASAFVIVCASTLVLERLWASGHGSLSAVHFAGVGIGIMISAAAVSAMLASGADWRGLWIGSGSIAVLAVAAVALLVPARHDVQISADPGHHGGAHAGLGAMIVAYGLFGFGYVITATFLVAIVRLTYEVRVLEPWIWILFGLAAIPSVAVWCWLGERIGLMNAFAAACLIEAIGIVASVEWVTISGVCLSAVLLGGTFMGITALGLMAARDMSGGQSQRAIGRMTASFGVGQMVGPTVAGVLFEQLGSFRAASLVATAALVVSGALALWTAMGAARDVSRHRIA
jgi:predicted MFS family arabinose efflux permease